MRLETTTLQALLLALTMTFFIVALVLWYLRGITRRILLSICANEDGADFWLRSLNVMAMSGALIVTLALSRSFTHADLWLDLRNVLLGTLVAVFMIAGLIASTIWRHVSAPSQKASYEANTTLA